MKAAKKIHKFDENQKGSEGSRSPQDSKVSKAQVEAIVKKIADLVSEKPEKAATILTGWLNQGAKKKAG